MKRLLFIGLCVGLLLGSCLSYLVLTQSGLRLLCAVLLPDSIQLGAAYGRVLGPVRVEDLRFEQPGVAVRAEQISIDWRLARALRGDVIIEILSVEALEIVLDGAGSRAINVTAAAGIVTVTTPYTVDLELDWALEPPAGGTVRGTGWVAGSLESLDATLTSSSPFEWQAVGTINDVTGEARWEVTIEVPEFEPVTINPNWPTTRLGGRVELHAGETGIAASGSLLLPEWGTRRLTFNGMLDGGRDGIAIEALEFGIEGTPMRVDLAGDVSWAPEIDYEISGQWRSIAWTFTSLAEMQSPDGRFDLAGSLSSYEGSLSGRLRAPDNLPLSPEGSLDATFNGSASSVQFNDITIRTTGGEISGTASVDWLNEPRFDAELRGERFDPGLFVPEIAGEIDFGLTVEAASTGEAPDYRLQLESLSGVINNQAVSGRAGLQSDANGNALAEIDLRSGESTLSGRGLIGPMLDVVWQIDTPDLSEFYPQFTGALRGQGRLSGDRASPRVEVSAIGTDIGLGEVRVGTLDTQIDFDAGTGIIRESRADLRDFRWRELTFERITAAAEGSVQRHVISADLTAIDGVTRLRAEGGYRDQRWSGELSNFESERFGGWVLESPIALEVTEDELASSGACLLGNPGRVCVAGAWSTGGTWDVESDLVGIDLERFDLFLPQGYDYAGSISAVFRGRGSPNAAWQGTASIEVDDVTVTTQEQSVALLKNGSGNAELTIDDSVFALDVLLDSQQGELEAHARAGRSGPDAALAGEMRGFLSSLELLTLPFPELLDVTGELAFNVELQGSVGTPVYSGGISLLDGAASLVATGITLENISLELTGSADEIIIGGEAHSGEGAVRLDGALGWPEGTPSGRFSFGGQQFRFIDLPGIRVDASPDLELVVAGRELELTGNVHVDSVDVAPIDLRQAVRVSPDEIVIGETAPERWRISSRVSVSLGEDVAIDAYGLEGRVRGSLSLVDLPGRPATGSGELAIEDGLFSAYGQSLDIERGRLLFSGGPLDNPTLDVRAVRQFETITVGVDVRGPLQDPQITVFSDPPRPRQYALATLIMGAAPVELGRASDTLAYGRSSGPGDRTIGLGDLSAGGASSPNSFLAPDFYLGYLESISLRYRLSRRWTIGVGRGAETSLDVAYSVR